MDDDNFSIKTYVVCNQNETNVKTDVLENYHNFKIKILAFLNLYKMSHSMIK